MSRLSAESGGGLRGWGAAIMILAGAVGGIVMLRLSNSYQPVEPAAVFALVGALAPIFLVGAVLFGAGAIVGAIGAATQEQRATPPPE